MSKLDKGHRIAHRELDDEQVGSARAGVVEEVIGEEEPRLVVARFDEGEREAFDERELVDLGSAKLSDGPVILRPRHLARLLRARPVVLALVFVAVAAAAMLTIALAYDWSAQAEAIAAAVVLVLAVLIARGVQGELRRRGKSAG